MAELTPFLPHILSATVGLMGTLVAGLTVYVNYRGRHNQFRTVVYGRQMDAYFDIAESMSHLYTAAANVLAVGSPWRRGEDVGARFRAAVREEHERFTAAVNRALIVLPSKVKAAVDHFHDTLLDVGAPPHERPAGADRAADPKEVLARAYERAINCIRHHLAVDSLTTGLLREMGIGTESVALKTVRAGVNPLVPVGRPAR